VHEKFKKNKNHDPYLSHISKQININSTYHLKSFYFGPSNHQKTNK